MSLRRSYTFIAPIYDWIAGPAFSVARQQSLAALPPAGHSEVLLNGVGTGLDLPYLPAGHRYTGLDLAHAMLARAARRPVRLDVGFVQADSLALPFRDARFDYAVLHLILTVLSKPVQALRETARVLKPGGYILLFDKFLRPGAPAPLRRLISPIVGRIATRTDVVFEEVLSAVSGLTVLSDEPALAGGWFCRLTLRKD